MLVANLATLIFVKAHVAAFWMFQGEEPMTWDPLSLWNKMGWPARTIVIILLVMSAWSIGVMIDRWVAFNAARKQSRQFAPAVAGALREGKLDEAIRVAERNKKSHLAKVVTAGLQEFKAHDASNEIPGEQIQASKRALERAEAIVHAELKRGLGGLATIGSTAPFVGLLGTVIGILNSFRKMSESKAMGLAAVSGGIAEALVTTALGLFVAIPAVMMFNYFTGKVEAFDVEMDNSSSELVDYFLKRTTAESGGKLEERIMSIVVRNEGAKVNSNINVTPMVDVMLVLLIIFMVVTPMLQHGPPVELARANNPSPMPDADKEDALLVAVNREGKVFFGNDQVKDPGDLTQKIRDRIASRTDKKVYVKADARSHYKAVVEVVDNVRSAGVSELGLLTEQRRQ